MTRHPRLTAAALALLLILTLALSPALAADEPTPAAEPDPPLYADVAPTAWYAGAVQHCFDRGLMTGTGDTTFSPDATMSRAMIATVLYRMDGEPEVYGSGWFSDVPQDAWYAKAVNWAFSRGIMDGMGLGTFSPDVPVTREALANILWRYAGHPWAGNADPYADQADIDVWNHNAVAWAKVVGIMSGMGDNQFVPKAETNRAQVATVLMNYDLWLHPELNTDPNSRDHWADLEKALGYRPFRGALTSNPYISSGFVADTSNWHMSYQYQPYTLGIDVSSHQKEVDWQAVAASGIQFAMIRAGYRGYTQGSLNVDPYFERNIRGALAAGLDVGIYFFSQAVTVDEAIEEARYTMELISGYPITYPVVFDWERQDKDNSRTRNTSTDAITAAAVAFCETVKKAGYTPMMYASPSKVYNTLGDSMGYLTGYPFWLAHYTKNMAPSSYRYDFDMWQYTSSGRVPGVQGNVDMNICLTDWRWH